MDRFEERARERLQELDGIDIDAFATSFALFRLATQYLTFLEKNVHRPRGLSTGGFRVLFTLWVYDELEPRQMATLSGVSTAAISGVLGTLESKGLIEKRRSSSDRRLVHVRLTPSGRNEVTDLYREQNRVEQAMLADLASEDLAETLRTLRQRLGDGG